jgi:hypothetical protein
MTTKNYDTGLYDRLRDPAYAKEYLRAALDRITMVDDESSDAIFLLALRDIAKANHMKPFNPILELSALEVECLTEDNFYGAALLASILHYLITGKSFGYDAMGKPSAVGKPNA